MLHGVRRVASGVRADSDELKGITIADDTGFMGAISLTGVHQ